ncbi:MAG: hypothetical protein UV79_C0020G0006 [candidate division TM6 bacterium GW2011_GWF2_43_17]|nr:MAG: hypothetical protein UV79_C0020G0006 [candidate division TM6 bacterium GW2011_GWF2_43_17]
MKRFYLYALISLCLLGTNPATAATSVVQPTHQFDLLNAIQTCTTKLGTLPLPETDIKSFSIRTSFTNLKKLYGEKSITASDYSDAIQKLLIIAVFKKTRFKDQKQEQLIKELQEEKKQVQQGQEQQQNQIVELLNNQMQAASKESSDLLQIVITDKTINEQVTWTLDPKIFFASNQIDPKILAAIKTTQNKYANPELHITRIQRVSEQPKALESSVEPNASTGTFQKNLIYPQDKTHRAIEPLKKYPHHPVTPAKFINFINNAYLKSEQPDNNTPDQQNICSSTNLKKIKKETNNTQQKVFPFKSYTPKEKQLNEQGWGMKKLLFIGTSTLGGLGIGAYVFYKYRHQFATQSLIETLQRNGIFSKPISESVTLPYLVDKDLAQDMHIAQK